MHSFRGTGVRRYLSREARDDKKSRKARKARKGKGGGRRKGGVIFKFSQLLAVKTFDDDINHEGGDQGADQDYE